MSAGWATILLALISLFERASLFLSKRKLSIENDKILSQRQKARDLDLLLNSIKVRKRVRQSIKNEQLKNGNSDNGDGSGVGLRPPKDKYKRD